MDIIRLFSKALAIFGGDDVAKVTVRTNATSGGTWTAACLLFFRTIVLFCQEGKYENRKAVFLFLLNDLDLFTS
jgi:hypothetical protein